MTPDPNPLLITRWFLALLLSAAVAAADSRGQPPRRWMEARARMVREAVIGAGIQDKRVQAALRETPRHRFVPPSQRKLAYLDMALPIGTGQTISPPFVVAYMTEQLDPQPSDKVLEIGTGSGYQAAVLSRLVAEVYSIEIVESLGRKAAQTLRRLNYTNVHTKIGDGFQGWPEHAPFDKIIVTCSPENIPRPLIEQLREGGRMVIPLGARYQQTLYLLKKRDGKMQSEALQPTFFVPMTGRAEQLRARKDDSGLPQLVNGSFESARADRQPQGWYYVRQAEVVSDARAPDGHRLLRFENQTPGRGAQALQSMAMDGRQVREIAVSIWIQMQDVRPGRSARQLPQLELNLFDAQRAPIGVKVLGPWYGTARWARKQARIKVPAQARLSVLAVGMFGGTGQFSIDAVTVNVVQQRRP